MSELVEFLRARLDEDEERARHVQRMRGGHPWSEPEPWRLSWQDEYDLLCIEPSRALVEVDAKRQRLDAYIEACEAVENTADLGDWSRAPVERAHAVARRDALREAVELDALPYAGHPDYRDEWRPT